MRHTVDEFMTPAPHTIGRDQTLSSAHRIMREHRIRHLPVLDIGRLVGVVSAADLHLVESLKDVDPDQVTVDDAMEPDPLIVPPRAPLEDVATSMVRRRCGSALVVDEDRIVGVFTTVDALRALAALVTGRRKPVGQR